VGDTTIFAARGVLVVATGATERTVHASVAADRVLAVSPDLAHAVVVAGDRVYVADLASGRAAPLPGVTPAGAPVFADGGRVLAVVGTLVRTFDSEGRPVAASPVVTTRPAAQVSLVTWSP
jgi:hypothetical protein